VSAVNIISFLLGSLVIGAVSWKSLGKPASHGFYRFFAFELLLLLIIIVAPDWFADPLSPYQQISWFVLIISLMLIVHSTTLLIVVGLPRGSRPGSPNLPFENTTRMVIAGIFHFIRHPMYTSVILLNLGVFLKSPSRVTAGIGFMATVFLYLAARVEEKGNVAYFGSEYLNYMKKTKMFIPFLF
jgi:protein-S-isoprenylcysteine O-methyltransferase Ste14